MYERGFGNSVGQRLLRTALKDLLRAQSVKDNSVRCLRECAHGYAEEADLLLLSMVRDGAPTTIIEAAEKLFDDFRQAEEELEGLLASVTLRAS